MTITSSLPAFIPVILAGGSGTRFWPRSRRARAKQVLALDGERTMIQQTVDRLLPLASPDRMWVVANNGVAEAISTQLPDLPRTRLLCEPVARNTAPACGLMAFIALREDPDAVLGVFPSDQVIRGEADFVNTLKRGIALASSGPNIVVLGIDPTHPETGYGYIELGSAQDLHISGARPVRSFTEKPDLASAQQMLASGRYAWNSGMFVARAQTLCQAIDEHAPHISATLQAIADAYGSAEFPEIFAALYPSCQNISIDFAVLEPQSRKRDHSHMYCFPASFEWKDLGSWSALHEHRSACAWGDADHNVVESPATSAFQSRGNYVYAPGRHVALLGVQNLVVVLTDDAVLVTTRERSQDVASVVRSLSEAGHTNLL
ncbi:mannose-1-phosphate guanylyltransferase [Terriglobus aquaticus]|uniref:Mannose-1-phosphate guanylyltransferase n=1 Tax=Terriglobus aquaticus TaxID=940139 RepID=A0ABW9KGD9_9BACT|nr:sugar phosphate nucleotidyltransferase [Terriglobus aquaticus]